MIAAHAAMAVLLATPAPVELRGGRIISAPIVDISPDGVQVGGDEPRVIAWDNVRSVDGEWAARAAPYAEVSDLAWRARTRLARGDTLLAAPLFEQLFPRYRDEDGSLALMIAEGLYRCRCGEGDTAGAFEAWLVAAELRQRGVEIAGDPPMAPLLDPETVLPPKVPPIFIPGPQAERVARAAERALQQADTGMPASLRRIIESYHAAAVAELNHSTSPTLPGALPEAPGPRLVALIAMSRSEDQAIRTQAREQLSAYRTGEHQDTWREAWARAAIGRSLLMELDADRRISGVIELLHLPARFADSQPHLAAIALAEASKELARTGDAAGARHLREELELIAPGHEALDWLETREPGATARNSDAAPSGDPS